MYLMWLKRNIQRKFPTKIRIFFAKIVSLHRKNVFLFVITLKYYKIVLIGAVWHNFCSLIGSPHLIFSPFHSP